MTFGGSDATPRARAFPDLPTSSMKHRLPPLLLLLLHEQRSDVIDGSLTSVGDKFIHNSGVDPIRQESKVGHEAMRAATSCAVNVHGNRFEPLRMHSKGDRVRNRNSAVNSHIESLGTLFLH